MACPPGNCAAWGAFRLCKPLPPIVIDGSYSPDELQLLWFCWRARSTGEYGGNTPVNLGFDTPGLIDISKTTNIDKIIAYCDSRGTLVRQFTNFSRFGVKFNLPNFKATGSFSTWSGGIFGGATSPGGGGGDIEIAPDPTGEGGGSGGGGAGTCGCTPDAPDLLTVVVCTPLDCEASADLTVKLTVCGGTPPYSWSLSGGGGGSPVLVQSGTNNRNANVTAPSNTSGSGEAYRKIVGHLDGVGCTLQSTARMEYDCQDELIDGVCHTDTSDPCGLTGPIVCREVACVDPLPVCGGAGEPCGAGSIIFSGGGAACDTRDAIQIAAGCLPCAVSMDGLNITVEDDVGATVVTVLEG